MYTSIEEHAKVDALPGVTRQLVVAGERAMAVKIELAAGSSMAIHTHPHEQIGFVLSGKIEMSIAGEIKVCGAGDSYAIAGGVPHGAVSIPEDCVVVDIFSPIREEYLS